MGTSFSTLNASTAFPKPCVCCYKIPEFPPLIHTSKGFAGRGPVRGGPAGAVWGEELGFDALVRVVQEIARACGSTGWVYSVVAMHQWLVGLFPQQIWEDVLGKGSSLLASSSFPPMGTVNPSDGGFRLTGKWIFASGCDNTSWPIIGGRAPLYGREHPLQKDNAFHRGVSPHLGIRRKDARRSPTVSTW